MIKIIIIGLTIILITLSLFTCKSYKNIHKASSNTNNQTTLEQQTYRVIDKESVIKALSKENSLNVLKGIVNTRCAFTNKNITENDVTMKWLRDKIDTWNSKDITVDSQFSFMFSYNMSNPQVTIKNDTIYIDLSYNKLSLNKCELSDVQTNERVGWLQNNFSSSEINSINSRIRDYARNTILSNESFRKEGIENLKENITDQIHTYVSDKVNIGFSVNNYDVVSQDDVSIIK
ncbi:hypothetical protein [Clostridium beijerinckii]|nr:hypothetical protein [Clostridium beijerinckii]NRU52614.1 flagellar basal body-associated protein FliL [Clostridium beijerinckii]